jgi:hypothetical protein
MQFLNKTTFFIAIFAIFIASCAKKKETPTDIEATTLSEGTMTFDITVKDADKLPGIVRNMLPKEGKCFFSGNKMAMQVESLLATAIVVSDGDAKMFTTSVDGSKTQAGEAEVLEKMKKAPVKLEETTETKQILGMTATKYTLKLDSTQTPISFYVVKDAPVGNLYWALPTGTLQGLIVEYEFKSEMGTLMLTAKSLDKTKPDGKVFE